VKSIKGQVSATSLLPENIIDFIQHCSRH